MTTAIFSVIHYGNVEDKDYDKKERAIYLVSQFLYRKMFSLSWEEFCEEPYEIFLANSTISSILSQKEGKNNGSTKDRINN